MPSSSTLIRHRRQRREAGQNGLSRLWRALATLALSTVSVVIAALVIAGIALSQAYTSYVADLPSAETLEAAFSSTNNQFFQTTKIYDRTGTQLLYEVIDPRAGDRQWLSIDKIPKHFVEATISIEDKTFFTNPGYDVEGIIRAFVSNLRGGSVQGGSTITQQLVKNVIIAPGKVAEQSYDRKLREVFIAAEVTERYSKDQILEWYLNTNFYGNLAYGIDAAARVYFGKSASELDLAESALLAAIPQFPALNPLDAPEDAKHRQELVLDAMAREGYITKAEAEQAKAEDVLSRLHPFAQRFDIRAPHFSLFALNELVNQLGPDLTFRGGLKVITTIDLGLQDQVECAARTQVARLSGGDPALVIATDSGTACEAASFLPPMRQADIGVDHNVSNASVVVMDPRTGQILAMLGSLDYWEDAIDGRFNVAADGRRQPGSSFKPFTYLTAFSQGYTPATMVLDVRTAFPQDTGIPYVPENYDRQFHGPVSLRIALARSYNIPAVDMMNRVGVENVIRTAHRMGLNTLDRETNFYGLALTLGGGEVSLLDMTYAYSVMANGGRMAGVAVPPESRRGGYRQLDPVSILRIEDSKGSLLVACGEKNDEACSFTESKTQQVLEAPLAYLITHVLSDNEARIGAFGRPNPLEIDRPAAVKTGTTDDFIDNWTLGYTPQAAVGVWVGNTDSSPMEKVTGLTGAAPIWHAVMKYATQNLPIEEWPEPPGVNHVTVCYPSGLLPTRDCQSLVNEVFISGTEPAAEDNVWQAFQINRETGKLATVYTPPELVEKRVYEILPPEAADWVRQAGLPQPPAEYDTIYSPPEAVAGGDVFIASLQPFSYIHGAAPITGTVKSENFSFFRVQFGPGLNPTQWTQIGGDRGEQIENGDLQPWDTTGLNGLYSVQLLVVKNDQTFVNYTVQVTVDNTPPTVTLVTPTEGQLFALGSDEAVVIQPEAQDNLSLAYVEVFVDGAKLDTTTVAPFTSRWKLGGTGQHSIYVRAVDAAGNVTESERVVVVVQER
ncbi:MAG: transglycosylase domain-containing protein [Chloroflexi bacterium]|nr:transglycosylase domain-containing protein [Chloroflexota bacterium]